MSDRRCASSGSRVFRANRRSRYLADGQRGWDRRHVRGGVAALLWLQIPALLTRNCPHVVLPRYAAPCKHVASKVWDVDVVASFNSYLKASTAGNGAFALQLGPIDSGRRAAEYLQIWLRVRIGAVLHSRAWLRRRAIARAPRVESLPRGSTTYSRW